MESAPNKRTSGRHPAAQTAMHPSRPDDPKLSDVKAVLKRLQRISGRSSAVGKQSVEDDAARQRHVAQLVERPVRERPDSLARAPDVTAVGDQVNPSKRHANEALVAAAFLALVLVAIYTFIAFRQPSDSTVELPSPTATLPSDPAPGRTDAVTTKSSAVPPIEAADGGISKEPPTDAPALSPVMRLQRPPNSQDTLRTASELITAGHIRAGRAELLGVMHEGSADVAWALARSYDPNFLGSVTAADAPPDIVEATRWYRRWYGIAVKQGLVTDSVSLERIINSMR